MDNRLKRIFFCFIVLGCFVDTAIASDPRPVLDLNTKKPLGQIVSLACSTIVALGASKCVKTLGKKLSLDTDRIFLSTSIRSSEGFYISLDIYSFVLSGALYLSLSKFSDGPLSKIYNLYGKEWAAGAFIVAPLILKIIAFGSQYEIVRKKSLKNSQN